MLHRHWLCACLDTRRETATGIDLRQQCHNSPSQILREEMRLSAIKQRAITAGYYTQLRNHARCSKLIFHGEC